MSRKQEFESALRDFLKSLRLMPHREVSAAREKGEIQIFCFMYTYESDHQQLIAPLEDWTNLLAKTNAIFESKINRKLLQQTIEKRICKKLEQPFSEITLDRHCKAIYKALLPHYNLIAEALLPLYNITFRGHKEVQLANSFLSPEHPDSLLIRQMKKLREAYPVPFKNCFLRISVSGDEESRERQTVIEASKSLAVLRFVTMWQSRREGAIRVKFNPAIDVSFWGRRERHIFFYRPDQPERIPGFNRRLAEQHYLSEDDLQIANDFYGLDNVNYHYSRQNNTLSSRITRALEIYDSGVQATTNWKAVYRYVVSINVVIPTSGHKADKLTENLTTLMKFGGNFVGSMKREGAEDLPEGERWNHIIHKTVGPFADFYELRGRVLHGNEGLRLISDDEVQEVRTLAHNAIRLMAFVARDFGWDSYDQAKNWFKKPSYPPSLADQVDPTDLD